MLVWRYQRASVSSSFELEGLKGDIHFAAQSRWGVVVLEEEVDSTDYHFCQ